MLAVVAILVNSLLWLDSFDRYLSSRYHIYLSSYLPESAFIPSRVLQEMLTVDEQAEPASSGSGVQPDAPGPMQPKVSMQQSAAVPQGASAVQGQAAAPEIKPHEDQHHLALREVPPRILFAGDSMMQGVAPFVVSRLRKEYPRGVFVDLSRPSTGLTAKRYFDWPARIRDETTKQALQTVVVFLGPNDPWDIYEAGKRDVFPSADWERKYRDRVDEVLTFAASRGIHVIWIGLPAMRDERIKRGAKIENRIFQDETRKYKFDYLSTEDFLGGLDEPYKTYLDEPGKGKVVVRADDGVHFTTSGLRMISSRVEELIRKRQR